MMVIVMKKPSEASNIPPSFLTSPTGNFKTYMLHTTNVLPAKLATYIPSKGAEGRDAVGAVWCPFDQSDQSSPTVGVQLQGRGFERCASTVFEK